MLGILPWPQYTPSWCVTQIKIWLIKRWCILYIRFSNLLQCVTFIAVLSTAAVTGCPDGCDKSVVLGATIKKTSCSIRNTRLHHSLKKSLIWILIQPVQSRSHCFPTSFEVIYVIILPVISPNSSFASDLVTSNIIKHQNNLKRSGNSKSSCCNTDIIKPQRSVYVPPGLTP